jgi:hypothetical protein
MLIPMIERSSGNLDYRVRLMNAYFHTKQKEKLLATLKDADTFWHADSRWSEGPMATLASACIGVELWDRAVAYYKELIPLHERTQPNRGVGNGVLSVYYTLMATAYSRLGQTIDAVDAASGAIVAWGERHRDRTHYLEVLRTSPIWTSKKPKASRAIRFSASRWATHTSRATSLPRRPPSIGWRSSCNRKMPRPISN